MNPAVPEQIKKKKGRDERHGGKEGKIKALQEKMKKVKRRVR